MIRIQKTVALLVAQNLIENQLTAASGILATTIQLSGLMNQAILINHGFPLVFIQVITHRHRVIFAVFIDQFDKVKSVIGIVNRLNNEPHPSGAFG
jgi:hypothetical protein